MTVETNGKSNPLSAPATRLVVDPLRVRAGCDSERSKRRTNAEGATAPFVRLVIDLRHPDSDVVERLVTALETVARAVGGNTASLHNGKPHHPRTSVTHDTPQAAPTTMFSAGKAPMTFQDGQPVSIDAQRLLKSLVAYGKKVGLDGGDAWVTKCFWLESMEKRRDWNAAPALISELLSAGLVVDRWQGKNRRWHQYHVTDKGVRFIDERSR